VAVKVALLFWQTVTLLAVGATGVMEDVMAMLFFTGWQPGVWSLTVTVYVPALLTLMDGVVSPVLQV
jgi:hypothetical protein